MPGKSGLVQNTACWVSAAVMICIVFAASCARQFEGNTYGPMQQDFDRIRLDHLFVIASLIHEYESEAGHLPFSDATGEKAVAVVVASSEQLKLDDDRVPIILDLQLRAVDHIVPEEPELVEIRSAAELTRELEVALGRKIILPTDPQVIPVNKPTVYVFTSYRGVFDICAFLHNDFPFARELGPFNNKIAVGNRSNPEAAIWTAEELMSQGAFRTFFSQQFNRSGYTLQTEISPD